MTVMVVNSERLEATRSDDSHEILGHCDAVVSIERPRSMKGRRSQSRKHLPHLWKIFPSEVDEQELPNMRDQHLLDHGVEDHARNLWMST